MALVAPALRMLIVFGPDTELGGVMSEFVLDHDGFLSLRREDTVVWVQKSGCPTFADKGLERGWNSHG